MKNEYLITDTDLEEITHFKEMFEHNAVLIENLCDGEKSDIVYGFELGKLYMNLRKCYIEMIDLEDKIKKQIFADVHKI